MRKPKHHHPAPFWKGRNRLLKSAVKTQELRVPWAMKLVEESTAGWHKDDWLPARPRRRSHHAQPGVFRGPLWLPSSPRRCHSTCWGLTGLGAGNSMTPRLECHLLNHHHCYPWQFGDLATEFETKAATPEIFKLCRISNHMFKCLNLEITSLAAPKGVTSAVSQQLIQKKDRFD